jgi:hypothetical protein
MVMEREYCTVPGRYVLFFAKVGQETARFDFQKNGRIGNSPSALCELINSFGGPKMRSMDLRNVENEFHSGEQRMI